MWINISYVHNIEILSIKISKKFACWKWIKYILQMGKIFSMYYVFAIFAYNLHYNITLFSYWIWLLYKISYIIWHMTHHIWHIIYDIIQSYKIWLLCRIICNIICIFASIANLVVMLYKQTWKHEEYANNSIHWFV